MFVLILCVCIDACLVVYLSNAILAMIRDMLSLCGEIGSRCKEGGWLDEPGSAQRRS